MLFNLRDAFDQNNHLVSDLQILGDYSVFYADFSQHKSKLLNCFIGKFERGSSSLGWFLALHPSTVLPDHQFYCCTNPVLLVSTAKKIKTPIEVVR